MKQLNTAIIRVKNGDGEFRTLQAIRGATSYEVAVQNGFVGSESEWLAMMLDDGWVTKCQELDNNKASKQELLAVESGAYKKDDVLSNNTRELLGLNVGTVPDEAFLMLFDICKNNMQNHIAIGEYTGVGGIGADYPCTLSFNGKVELIIVQGADAFDEWFCALNGVARTHHSHSINDHIYLTWSDNSVSWHSKSSNTSDQLNVSGRIYRYFAIINHIGYGSGEFSGSAEGGV